MFVSFIACPSMSGKLLQRLLKYKIAPVYLHIMVSTFQAYVIISLLMNLMIKLTMSDSYLIVCIYGWEVNMKYVLNKEFGWTNQILKVSKSKLMVWILKSSCGMTKWRKKIQRHWYEMWSKHNLKRGKVLQGRGCILAYNSMIYEHYHLSYKLY